MKKFNIHENEGLIRATTIRVAAENHFVITPVDLKIATEDVLSTISAEDLYLDIYVAYEENGKQGVVSRVLYPVCRRHLEERKLYSEYLAEIAEGYDRNSKHFKYVIYCDYVIKLLHLAPPNKQYVIDELDFLCDKYYISIDIDEVLKHKCIGFDDELDAKNFANSLINNKRAQIVPIFSNGEFIGARLGYHPR